MPAPGAHPILLPSCAVHCGKYCYGRHWYRRQEEAPAAGHWEGRVEAQPVGGSALHWQVLPCSAWQWEERTYRRLRDGAGSHAALAASSGCKSALMERDAQPVGRETRHCPALFLHPACPAQAQGETRRGREAQLLHLGELWASPSVWEGWPALLCSKPHTSCPLLPGPSLPTAKPGKVFSQVSQREPGCPLQCQLQLGNPALCTCRLPRKGSANLQVKSRQALSLEEPLLAYIRCSLAMEPPWKGQYGHACFLPQTGWG